MTWKMSTETETAAARSADDEAAQARGFFELDGTGGPLPPPVAPAVASGVPVLAMAAPAVAASGPALPPATPIPPPMQSPAPANGYLDLEPLTTQPSGPQPRRGGRRAMSWLLVLALLGGLAFAGVRFGPDLFDLARSEEDPSTDAPLVFPTATLPVEPVRTATISVNRPDAAGERQRYDATVDFESGVAQVVVDRGELPGLEIRAVFDEAVIRRVDQDVWYRTARGGFPFGGAGVDSWVRTLDQALPPEVRGATTIVEATDTPFALIDGRSDATAAPGDPATAVRSDIGAPAAETMRRLVIDIDQQQIAALRSAPQHDVPPSAIPPNDAPPDDIVGSDPPPSNAAAEAPAPGAEAPAEGPAGPPPDAPAPIPALTPIPVVTLPIGTPDPAQLATGEPVQLEVWIDQSGIVRHVATDDALGSESFTVHSTSAEPWLPTFPDESSVRELTAQAMLELRL